MLPMTKPVWLRRFFYLEKRRIAAVFENVKGMRI
jgi:hypothetical protein